MITKEVYNQIRGQDKISPEHLYEYYREKGGILNKDEFLRHFVPILAAGKIQPGGVSGLVQITHETATRRFKEYYNQKYGY